MVCLNMIVWNVATLGRCGPRIPSAYAVSVQAGGCGALEGRVSWQLAALLRALHGY